MTVLDDTQADLAIDAWTTTLTPAPSATAITKIRDAMRPLMRAAYARIFVVGGVTLAEVDATIASGETSLLLRRNVAGSYTLQRVTMGAIDSGGAGFKLLRVVN